MNICNAECCGCGLCTAVCPAGAITMQMDKEGFFYPQIDTSRCTECRLCSKLCPVNQSRSSAEEGRAEHHCRYAIAADRDMVAAASSGGIFPALAVGVLNENGAVTGAAFDEKFNVKLTLIERIQDLGQLMQAKYVQAEFPPELFHRALRVLEDGRKLLFSGTPCQIAAFKSFLRGRKYPGLLCVEVICNSVPSPGVWQSYLRDISEKNSSSIKAVSFRDKSFGWHKFSLKIDCGENVFLRSHKESSYMQLFLRGLISRKSCGECCFKNGSSGADISLGDFWKLHKVAPELNNSTGVSMVIVHNADGEKALRECDLAALREFPMDAVKVSNPRFFGSLIHNRRRDEYFSEFALHGGHWFDPDEYFNGSPPGKWGQKIAELFRAVRKIFMK